MDLLAVNGCLSPDETAAASNWCMNLSLRLLLLWPFLVEMLVMMLFQSNVGVVAVVSGRVALVAWICRWGSLAPALVR